MNTKSKARFQSQAQSKIAAQAKILAKSKALAYSKSKVQAQPRAKSQAKSLASPTHSSRRAFLAFLALMFALPQSRLFSQTQNEQAKQATKEAEEKGAEMIVGAYYPFVFSLKLEYSATRGGVDTLFTAYALSTPRFASLTDKELEEKGFWEEEIAIRHKYPPVFDTLKFKGKLRISWSFDMKYNKYIDLIFFPEENPFINYAALVAKDFPKKSTKRNGDRNLTKDSIRFSYDINHSFVKEVLAQSGLSKEQQERFFNARFGSVFMPMEIEFEWYVAGLYDWYERNVPNQSMTFTRHDRYLGGEDGGGYFCLGIIKQYKILPQDTTLNFPEYIASWEEREYDASIGKSKDVIKHLPYSKVFEPISTSALAYTNTNFNDFIVNLRDKPNAKEGKIVAQLFSQFIANPKDLYIPVEPGSSNITENPIYDASINKGKEWYEKDTGGSTDMEGYLGYYSLIIQKDYYKSHKPKLINPLNRDEYLVLVWNIDANNWAKVWVIKLPNEKESSVTESGSAKTMADILSYSIFRRHIYELNALVPSYEKVFLDSPSRFKLYEGYIHTSGLTFLASFGENYIKR
ncbi:hypothetical protein BKN38_09805 [Helicobacter sp. CLO-3]|nr:hypothetical protein BA723_09365 [Helicobacter sp. CLO-3]OHU81072.1 hypothetical protein BKN38_09805 [Helicobacter sp. CLO-3]